MVRRDANAEKGKYSKVGDSKTTSTGTGGGSVRSCLNRCTVCCISIFIIACILAIVGYGDSSDNFNDNLRSGQASEHSATATAAAPIKQKEQYIGELDNYEDDEYRVTEEDIDEAVEEVGLDLEIAAEDEFQRNTESIIKDAVVVFGAYVRIGISKMFSELSVAEIEELAEEIEGEVQVEFAEEYKGITDQIVQEEMYKIETMVDAEQEMGKENIDVEIDIYNSEMDTVDDLVNEIDDAALEITDKMQLKAAEIEQKILEERLSEKLGKTVKLMIVDNQVTTQNIEDLDDMVSDLSSLTRVAPPLPPLPPP